jgi:RNA polymerase sigma-70 factor (ECF subfamily)
VEDRARSRSPAKGPEGTPARALSGEGSRPSATESGRLTDADARLLERIRAGDVESGHRFVREHYGAICRYLLYLTGQPDRAEDLTQETFLQAWRYLDSFQGRGSLRSWLHRIAHREFLHLLRRQPAEPGLEEIAEVAAPNATDWTDAVELREVIDRLPLEQREVVLLHYLEGYSSTEIARIVDAPVGTVCYRLARARERLRQALGEDDLTYLNEPLAPMRQWAWLPLDQMHALEARMAMGGESKEALSMERREFLRQVAVGTAGLVLSEPGKEVVDGRLTQKVTLAFKGTALSDLCDHLRQETGVHVTAGASVADEKVTLFCKEMPLREVMRQLSRPFGYAWLRSAPNGQYRYELAQDLRSQLLEEELRNRDRNAALLALEREIEQYRPYLGLSPDEAQAKAGTAPPADKELLENLAGPGWGVIQIYFRLSAQQSAALRAGESVVFSSHPEPAEQPLPPDVARGMLQGYRDTRLQRAPGFDIGFDFADPTYPEALPLTLETVRVGVDLSISPAELGQLTLRGVTRIHVAGKPADGVVPGGWNPKIYAVGVSPIVQKPENGARNARFARDPALRPRVTLQPQPSCGSAGGTSPGVGSLTAAESSPPVEKKASTADVLKAVHRATGLPIVADFYTRLYQPDEVSVKNLPCFDALNQVADTMRLRWHKEGEWLQFRSTSYYDDRLKEVPNRLLTRWAGARRQRGFLPLDELLEIVQLPDAQLDGADMAEGARDCYGLKEWDLARNEIVRADWRYLASLTPEQRRQAMSPEGLAFTRMSLAQQQQFLTHGVTKYQSLRSLEELAGAVLRVEYIQPGEFEWEPAAMGTWLRWVVPLEPGPQGHRTLVPPIRARTPEETVQAARRIEPRLREALSNGFRMPADKVDQALQGKIVPTRLDLQIAYIPGTSNRLMPRMVSYAGDHRFFASYGWWTPPSSG